MADGNGLEAITLRRKESERLAQNVRRNATALELAPPPAACPDREFATQLKQSSVSQGFCLGQLLDSEAVRLYITEKNIIAQRTEATASRSRWKDRATTMVIRVLIWAAAVLVGVALFGKASRLPFDLP